MGLMRGVTLVAAAWLAAALAAPGLRAAASARAHPAGIDATSLLYIANVSYAGENKSPSTLSSIFSPRMDFDQWKPLTGRGDPLRNDPTYAYEPPVLERVRYWADEARYEREHSPERKSEVLMLGVSSRRPGAASRPPRRPLRPAHTPALSKYEEYSYKGERYPMTILVPPPPPRPGHQLPLFVLDDALPMPTTPVKFTELPTQPIRETTSVPDRTTSSYNFQESNLIYQSSSTANHNWIAATNHTKPVGSAVSSDYAGWGPTTPLQGDEDNDHHNFIFKDHNDYKNTFVHHPYSFYKPMLSEAPPPPKKTQTLPVHPAFLPTAAPPGPPTPSPGTTTVTYSPEETTYEVTSENYELSMETATEKDWTVTVPPTVIPITAPQPGHELFDMMASMLSMPLGNGPDRPEDNLYAHASEHQHVFRQQPAAGAGADADAALQSMQTMLPPPPAAGGESATVTAYKRPFHVGADAINHLAQQSAHTHDPYLHMRFTTPRPTATSLSSQANPHPTEETVPTYLIIQGHSKVKTYGSKPKNPNNHTLSNEIPKPNETNEVKHLHPIKEKHSKKAEKANVHRTSRARDLRGLVEGGVGSVELQEADVGIKYDVSDGSGVPAELYRQGIVESDENDYASAKKGKRPKRQISLEDLVPIDEDTLEEFVYNFLDKRRNATGVTGLIAQAVTGTAVDFADDLEDDETDEGDDR